MRTRLRRRPDLQMLEFFCYIKIDGIRWRHISWQQFRFGRISIRPCVDDGRQPSNRDDQESNAVCNFTLFEHDLPLLLVMKGRDLRRSSSGRLRWPLFGRNIPERNIALLSLAPGGNHALARLVEAKIENEHWRRFC